jgi:DNA N-6-adenine-methyltransferase (Dam)
VKSEKATAGPPLEAVEEECREVRCVTRGERPRVPTNRGESRGAGGGRPRPPRNARVHQASAPSPSACSFGRSPARWIAQDYQVRDEYVADVLRRLGVHPQVDAFADRYNKRFPRWWGKRSPEAWDAFEEPWDRDILWMNPPYSRISDVVRKVKQDAAHVVLVVPRWTRRLWYKKASEMAVSRLTYPAGTRFFTRKGRVCRGPGGP